MTQAQSVKHAGWYKRLFAAMMARDSTRYDRSVLERKRTLLSPLRGNVLEIGPGTGPNLRYYAPDVRWVGIEPNPAMYSYLQQEADRLGINVDLRDGVSEHLAADDNRMDAVVSTLVMCSVRDPDATLKEVLRVLRPGGKFVFMEHVAAPRGTGRRRLQSFLQPIWGPLGDGCHVDRETWTNIERAGFSQINLEHFHVNVPITGPHIAGFAVK